MSGLIDYLKTLFGERIDEMKDPEVEIEQAINAARDRDQQLRNQAAKVIAHRSMIAGEIEDAAEELARAKELAKQALLKADDATRRLTATAKSAPLITLIRAVSKAGLRRFRK